MNAAPKQKRVSVEDYLAGELISPIKHEYVDGRVYAMAGARNAHNIIATNALSALHSRLRGRSCRAWNSDTKIRLRFGSGVRFYYPDVSVVCRANPPTDSFQDEPVVIIEVLSSSTRRIDEGEKKDDYLTIPSLAVYVLIEQEAAEVVAYRRAESGFVQEVHVGRDAVLPLGEIGTELPLAEIYEDLDFSAEPTQDAEN